MGECYFSRCLGLRKSQFYCVGILLHNIFLLFIAFFLACVKLTAVFRNRFWHELTQTKFHENYACEIISSKRSLVGTFNIIIAAFSTTGGIMGWKIWESLPLISCILIAIISLSKLLAPHIIPSEKQLEKYDKIFDYYTKAYVQLEQLWYEYEAKRLNEADVAQKFFAIKNAESSLSQIINENIRGTNQKLIIKAEKKSALYFEKVFN